MFKKIKIKIKIKRIKILSTDEMNAKRIFFRFVAALILTINRSAIE